MTSEPMMSAHKLRLLLGQRYVVDDFSACLQPGQWVAIVGPNGAGKSSLLSLLAGLRKPTDGQVTVSGKKLSDLSVSKRAQMITWLAQQGAAEGEIAAIDVVRLGRLPHYGLFNAPSAADEAAVQAALQETQSTDFADRPLNQLSGGERQRVLLARALAGEAPLLLLDEPTTHLDMPHQRTVVRSILRRTQRGVTVVAALHDLTIALMADRIWLIDKGRLVIDASPADPALHTALCHVFDQAMSIEKLTINGIQRFIAQPLI